MNFGIAEQIPLSPTPGNDRDRAYEARARRQDRDIRSTRRRLLGYEARFREALDDDLDTPAALQAVRDLEKDASLPDGCKFEMFAWFDAVLGLDLVRDVGKPPPALPEGATDLLDQRAAARAAKDWVASDRLRDELAGLGVAVRDTPDGQEWSPA